MAVKKFEVFETVGQTKKHISQMTQLEIDFLNEKLDNLGFIKKSKHLQTRKDTGEIPIQVFLHILRNKYRRQIVEYNETNKYGITSKRILVRDTRVIKTKYFQSHDIEKFGDANLCFVIDYETGIIITAYYNPSYDSHETIDMNRYDSSLCVC